MEQLYLMPGQERCERFKDTNGVPKVRYSYCSLHGALFNCVSRSVEEAQRLCEDWLVAGDVGAAQIHIVAVKADDLIIPRTHRTTFFRVFFYNKVETRLCQRDVFA